MVSHGHDHCPHCNVDLEGNEPQCPSCSGALFGVARRRNTTEIAKETAKNVISSTTNVVNQITDKATSAIENGLDKVSTSLNLNSKNEQSGVIQIMDASADAELPDEDISEQTTSVVNETSRLISEGEALASAGRPADAAEIFRSAIANDPTNPDCWFNLGVVQEQLGNADESIKSFNVALVHHSDHGPAMANLAVLLDAMGDNSAKDMAIKALTHFPGHPVLTKIVESTTVEHTGEKFSDMLNEPDNQNKPTAGLVIGEKTAAVEMNNSENIVDDADISSISNDHPDSNIHEENANEEENIVLQVESLEWDSEQDSLMNQAAEMLRKGQSNEVILMIQGDYITQYNNHARPHKILGAAYALNERIDEAIESFTTGLNLDNNDAPGWYNLGKLHIKNGHPDAGFTCFTASQMVDKSHISSARAIVEHLQNSDDYSKLVPAWIHLSTLEDLGENGHALAKILVEIGEGESIMIESNPDLPRTLPEGPELGKTAVKLLKNTENELMVRALILSGNYTEATRICKSILENNTNESSSWRLMAKVLFAQGNNERATQCS
jgi:tetratricopeptide (TPR) repeat protein